MDMDKLSLTINKIKALSETDEPSTQAQKHLDNLTKPKGSLGRLEDIAKSLVSISKNPFPQLTHKAILTMAGDHGVASEGVSAYPQQVTAQMVYNFLSGGAAINVLARHVKARVVVVDMGVAVQLSPHPNLIVKKVGCGSNNIAQGPAMSRDQAIKALEAGIEIVESEKTKGLDIVGTGDMGIANTTPSSAIISAITEIPPSRVTGRGTGIDNETYERKVKVVEQALKVNHPDRLDPIDVLAKVGGFEIGGIAGVILGAASHQIPVVIDGFISTAAALIAYEMCPKVRSYLFAAHRSAESGHGIALTYMGLNPILDLGMRLGEGTGAALAIGIIEAAAKIYAEMATFEQAGVSKK